TLVMTLRLTFRLKCPDNLAMHCIGYPCQAGSLERRRAGTCPQAIIMQYDFVPIVQRRPFKWPGGKRLAVILTTNLAYWDPVQKSDKKYYPGGPGIVGGDLPGNVYDNPNFTWREYGHRIGVWRLFEVFDGEGVPSSCTMNAKLALERKPIIDAALARGW